MLETVQIVLSISSILVYKTPLKQLHKTCKQNAVP